MLPTGFSDAYVPTGIEDDGGPGGHIACEKPGGSPWAQVDLDAGSEDLVRVSGGADTVQSEGALFTGLAAVRLQVPTVRRAEEEIRLYRALRQFLSGCR